MTSPEDQPVETPQEPPAEQQLPEFLHTPGPEPTVVPPRKRGWCVILMLAFAAVLVLGGLCLGLAFLSLRSTEANHVASGQAALAAGDWTGAEAAFTQALEIRPDSIRVHVVAATVGRGVARYHQGNYADALADFDAAQALDDSLAEPHVYRAAILFAQGDLPAALAEADLAQARDDSYGWPYAIQAYQHLRDLDMAQAEEAAEAALERDDALALAYRVLGMVQIWNYELDTGLATLGDATRLDPADAEALATRAYAHLELEDHSAAEADVQAAIQAAPDAAYTLWAQALLAGYGYDIERALELSTRAIALDSSRPEFFVTRSQCYRLTRDDLEKSGLDIEQALSLAPDYVPALAIQAWQKYGRYEYDTLKADAEHIVSLNDKRPEGYELLIAYFDVVEDDDATALEQAEALIAMFPERSSVYTARGYVYFELRDHEKAGADFEKALSLRADKLSALFGLSGLAFRDEDADKTIAYLNQVLEIDPENNSARVELAHAYASLADDQDKAWETIDDVLERDPIHPDGLLVRATFNSIEGDSGAVYKDLGRVLDSFPRHAYAYGLRSLTYLNDGNLDRAKADARKSVELDPHISIGYWALTVIAAHEEKWGDVASNATKVLDIDPESAEAYALRGEARYQQDIWNQAITDLETALELDPDLEPAYMTLASSYFLESQIPFAIQTLKKYLKLADDLDLISQAEELLAFLETVPPAVDGLHTWASEKHSYSMSYPTTWLQQPLLEEPIEESDGFAVVPKKAAFGTELRIASFEGAGGIPPQLLASLVNRSSFSNPTFKIVSRGFMQMGGRTGYYEVVEFTREAEEGDVEIRAKQYFVVRGDIAIILLYLATPAEFDRFETAADEIAASLVFE